MEDFEDKFAYERASKKVKEIRSFYINLACYCIVIPGLIAINLIYTPEYLWFFWSMAGWGIGLVFHAMTAFSVLPFFGSDWEERKLKEFMEKDRERQSRFNDWDNDSN